MAKFSLLANLLWITLALAQPGQIGNQISVGTAIDVWDSGTGSLIGDPNYALPKTNPGLGRANTSAASITNLVASNASVVHTVAGVADYTYQEFQFNAAQAPTGSTTITVTVDMSSVDPGFDPYGVDVVVDFSVDGGNTWSDVDSNVVAVVVNGHTYGSIRNTIDATPGINNDSLKYFTVALPPDQGSGVAARVTVGAASPVDAGITETFK